MAHGEPCLKADTPPVTLLSLPPEMLNHIAEFLINDSVRYNGCKDLCNFRGTCKPIRDSTYVTFAIQTVGTVSTTLCHSSFAKLESIAKNARLAPYVRRLSIEHQAFDGHTVVYDRAGANITWALDENGQVDKQDPYVVRLRKVLQRFPKCNSFAFVNQSLPECHNVSGGLSIGATLDIILSLTLELERPIKSFHVLNDGYYSLENAFALADQIDVRTLTTISQERLETLFPQLESLDIELRFPSGDDALFVSNILHFATLSTMLRCLKLNFCFLDGGADLMRPFLTANFEWQLQELCLENVEELRSNQLVPFFSQVRHSMKKLTLARLAMAEYGGWRRVLEYIAAEFKGLEFIKYLLLAEGQQYVFWAGFIQDTELGGGNDRELEILVDEVPDWPGTVPCVYHYGPGMDLALRKFAAGLVSHVPWP